MPKRSVAADVDRQMSPGRGVVPARQGTVAVQQGGEAGDIGDQARHVRRGREGSDPQRSVGVVGQSGLQRQPWSMWPVSSSGTRITSTMDSRHNSSLEWCSNGPTKTTGRLRGGSPQAQPTVWFGRYREAEDANELVDGSGRTGSGEDHRILIARADGGPDRGPGLLAAAASCAGRARCLRGGCWYQGRTWSRM